MNKRAVVLGGLVVAVAGAVYAISRPPEMPPAPPPPVENGNGGEEGPVTPPPSDRAPFQSASECRECHEDVYTEWQKSYHGMAWTDPMVQALSNGFRMTECIDCHAPLPIHITGVENRVAPRQHQRSDGVDCLSCHLMEDGVTVAAGRSIDTSGTKDACRPVLVKSMTDSTSCVGCHNQHETVDELLASGIDKNCLDCHMPPRDREGHMGRSHEFRGSHDQEMHKRATKLEVRVEEGNVVAKVTNVGAGHHIPTDARHRSYNVYVSFKDDRGNVRQDYVQMENGEFRLYYRSDFKPSTQIAHGKSREAKWPLPDGMKGTAHVRLVYALNPEELAAQKVTEVHTAEVAFP